MRRSDAYLQADDKHFMNFRDQLASLGLMLRDIPGDGLVRSCCPGFWMGNQNICSIRAQTGRKKRGDRGYNAGIPGEEDKGLTRVKFEITR